MYCRSCHYDLRSLPAGRCPECATAFDPADPATFDAGPVVRGNGTLVRIQLTGAALMLVFPVLVHISLIAARLSLGRWPQRWGADDPKGVPGIGGLLALATLGLFLFPVGAVVTLITPCVAVATRKGGAFWKLIAIGLIGWMSLVLARLDPAEAMVWFFD